MSEDRDIRDRNDPNIGLVAVEEAVRGPVAVARQRGVVLAVLVRPDGVVEDGVQGAAVNRVAFGHRDVGKAADINFSKVNHFVPDDRSWSRGAGLTGIAFKVLFKKIFCVHTNSLKFWINFGIKTILFELRGFQFVEHIIRKIGG